MKRIIKWGTVILFVCMYLKTCVYHSMTHINVDELEWVSNRHEGESMYFKSQYGDVDTLTIRSITIHNYLDPINYAYFNTSGTNYIAYAEIYFHFSYSEEGGMIGITKYYKDKPISFGARFSNNWLYRIPLRITSLRIDNVQMDDIMIIDNDPNTIVRKDITYYITSYTWSKEYGLVRYEYNDGKIFTRVFD